ncbi:hypothetical protein ACP70R_027298 [Stipagrostis hirtigluma subsp. patula]
MSSSSSSTGGKKPAAGSPVIRTLADLNRRPSLPGFPSPNQPQQYYAGGQRSGMLVQDPTNRNDADSIFEQARQMSALQSLTPAVLPGQSSHSRSFTGTGRLLSGATHPPQNVTHSVRFWNNGFTVDDGPLRSFEDPQSADFLQSIKKAECPRELQTEDNSTSVLVNIIKMNQDYQESFRPPGPFQGGGRALGSGSSAGESSATSPAVQGARPAARSIGFAVDNSLPHTSIQLRLADGTRMVARFNMHHTVDDIRAFIDASRSGAARDYQLQTGFPPKQLNDPTQTVEQAGLANSVVIQKL